MIRLTELIAREPAFNRIDAHLRRLAALDLQLRASLDEPLAHHCRVADVRDGTLTVHVDSPAWSARLRYRTPELLAQLRHRDPTAALRSVVIRVRPPESAAPAVAERPTPRLSPRTVGLLESIAAHTDNEALRIALLRLASRRD